MKNWFEMALLFSRAGISIDNCINLENLSKNKIVIPTLLSPCNNS